MAAQKEERVFHNEERVVEVSLDDARICLQNKHYGQAFANFLLFLKLRPERSQEVYFEFSVATKEWCDELESENRMHDLMTCYDRAVEMYPDHDVVLNNIGAQLFRLGYTDWAAWYIHRALVANPDYLAARDNLENVCSHLVERWHFPMLNDEKRNLTYRNAIDMAINMRRHRKVLDIGTGTGLLSMMCANSGATHITACEQSPAMVEVARDVIAANRIRDQVYVIHKSSLDLRVPDDMPEKVTLVVTETFDACLFGEHIVSTLCHAWKNLIAKDGQVIPSSADMYVFGIECEAIRTSNRLLYPALMHVDLSQVNLLSTVGRVAEEPYTTEDLTRVRGGYRLLTNKKKLLRVNFSDLSELEEMNSGKDWVVELEVRKAGRLDALGVCFDLCLDEGSHLSTAPNGKSCWEQAIYPITSLQLPQSYTYGTYRVLERDKMIVTFHFEQDCLTLGNCVVLRGGPVPRKKKSKPYSDELRTQMVTDYYSRMRKKIDDIAGSTDKQVVSSCSGGDEYITIEHSADDPGMDAECTESGATDRDTESSVKGERSAQQVHDTRTESDRAVTDGARNLLSDRTPTDDVGTKLRASDCDIGPSVGDSRDPQAVCDIHTENDNLDSCKRQCANERANTDKLKMESPYVDFYEDMVNKERMCGTASDGDDEYRTYCENVDCDLCFEHEKRRRSKPEDVLADLSAISLEKNPADSVPENAQSKVTFLADTEDIRYINDIYFNTQLCHSITQYRQDHHSRELSLLCVTPRLSFLAIQAVKIGYQSVTMAALVEHHETVRQVAALNGCTSGQITLVDLEEFQYPETPVDVIVCDVVEPCGDLRQQVLEQVSSYRINSVTDGGILLPGEVKVHGLFMESTELERFNRVMDDNRTVGLCVAEHINVFQIHNHIDIDLTVLPHKILSESFELFTVAMANITADNSASILNQAMERSIRIIHPGRVTGLVYWFELSFYGGVVVSTLDTRCHWKQACIVMKDEVEVDVGQTFVAKVMLQNSCLDVKIVQMEKGKDSHKA